MNASARRFEIGPVLLVLGALLLFASLFVEWFEPELTAWNAFEWLDLLLAVIALLVIVAALGLLLPGRALLDADTVPLLVAAPLAIVAVQLLDPPPFVADGDPSTGAWLALGGCLLMGAGAVLSFGRMHLSISFEGRDPRHRVSAVDARGSAASGSATGGEGGDGPFDQGGLGRGRGSSGAAKAAAGTRGGASGAAASGASASARPESRDRPAWSRPDLGGRRAAGAAGATRAEPTRAPASDAPGAGDPPLDAPPPPTAVTASEPAGTAAPAAPPPVAGPAPSSAEAPPDVVAPASGERPAEPTAGAEPPPPATPAGESPRRSGGLFGSWFDEPSRPDDDEDAVGGPGGTRPAGS
jgi:hypothetical protein